MDKLLTQCSPYYDNKYLLNFDDVIIVPQPSDINSRACVNVHRKLNFDNYRSLLTIPVCASNMCCIGTIEMAKTLARDGAMCALHKYHLLEEIESVLSPPKDRDYIWYSMGIQKQDIEKLYRVSFSSQVPLILIDVANGYITKFLDTIELVRKRLPAAIIMAGNVSTAAGAKAIWNAGADIVKVGIGPGKACSTTSVTGVGYGQITAILEIKDAAGPHQFICADGGCKTTGDICKALVAGADIVMTGYLFAGTDETINKEYQGDKKALYYGMSSQYAQDKWANGVPGYAVPEGELMEVPYKGKSAKAILNNICGAIRSTCTYVGARNVEELYTKSKLGVLK